MKAQGGTLAAFTARNPRDFLISAYSLLFLRLRNRHQVSLHRLKAYNPESTGLTVFLSLPSYGNAQVILGVKVTCNFTGYLIMRGQVSFLMQK
ncbi:hypothetical protein [Candidatus Methylobacter favarea]|uniref:hypothetical protein n=1 Tax=Candidatus Methylobacter favarea TaxID=2707345 RepID=UPI00157E0503|nr:hypothetical protein [Candidatus Methylobacter favarea]